MPASTRNPTPPTIPKRSTCPKVFPSGSVARDMSEFQPQPVFDQPPRDRILARQLEGVIFGRIQQLLPRHPARGFELLLIDPEIRAGRLGAEAEHQRGGERP